jgi:hypothetical protein
MPFNLANLVVTMSGDSSPLKSALAGVKSAVGAAAGGVSNFGGATTATMAEVERSVVSLSQQLTVMSGIPLGRIFSLTSLAGVAAGAGLVAKRFMDLSDEALVMPARLQASGLGARDAYGEFKKFQEVLGDTGVASREAIKSLTEHITMRGPERMRSDYQGMVANAQALSAATGMTLEQTTRWVGMGEDNFENYRRMLRMAGMMVRPHATQAEIMAKVNELARRGYEMMDTQTKTFGAQIQRIKNAFDSMRDAIAMAVGPAITAPIKAFADKLTDVIKRVRDFVNANREVIGSWAKVGMAIASVIASVAVLRAGLFLVRSFGMQAIGALLPIGPALGLIAGPARLLFGLFGGMGGSLMAGWGTAGTAVRVFGATVSGTFGVAWKVIAATAISVWQLGIMFRGIAGAVYGAVAAFMPLSRIVGVFTGGWTLIAMTIGKTIGLVGNFATATGLMTALGTVFVSPFNFLLKGLPYIGQLMAFSLTGPIRLLIGLIPTLGRVIRLAIISTGVGAIIALIGTLLALVVSFIDTGEEGASMFDKLKVFAKPFFDFMKGLWEGIKTEAQVLWMALREGWQGWVGQAQAIVSDLSTSIFGDSQGISNSLTGFWNDYVLPVWKSVSDFLVNLWKNILAEISVVGLRIRVIMLMLIVAFKSIPTVLTWLKDSFIIFLDWLFTNFTNIIYRSVMTAVRYYELLFTAVKDIFLGIVNFISDPSRGLSSAFNFMDTKKAMDKLKKEASGIVDGLDIPKLNLDLVGKDEKKKIADLLGEIDKEKGKARERHDERRKQIMDENEEKKKGRPPRPDLSGGRLIPGGFMDLQAQWKKIQEAAVHGNMETMEQLQKRQLQQTKASHDVLTDIKKNTEPKKPEGSDPLVLGD